MTPDPFLSCLFHLTSLYFGWWRPTIHSDPPTEESNLKKSYLRAAIPLSKLLPPRKVMVPMTARSLRVVNMFCWIQTENLSQMPRCICRSKEPRSDEGLPARRGARTHTQNSTFWREMLGGKCAATHILNTAGDLNVLWSLPPGSWTIFLLPVPQLSRSSLICGKSHCLETGNQFAFTEYSCGLLQNAILQPPFCLFTFTRTRRIPLIAY